MSKTGFIGALVARTDVVQNIDRRQRRAVVFLDDDAQTVG